MALKNARLGRAENLDEATRKKFGLPAYGLIIIETTNPDLKEIIKPISQGGIRDYLLTLGDFKDTELPE